MDFTAGGTKVEMIKESNARIKRQETGLKDTFLNNEDKGLET